MIIIITINIYLVYNILILVIVIISSNFNKFSEIPKQPAVEYQYDHPENLMKEVTNIFLIGLKRKQFFDFMLESLNLLDQNNIIKLLNEAWKSFWSNPDTFRHLEEESVKKLKFIP